MNNASIPAASNDVFLERISAVSLNACFRSSLIQQGKKRRYVNVTEITASSPHVFKIQSQTRPIFALAFKLFKGQTLVNTGQCVLRN